MTFDEWMLTVAPKHKPSDDSVSLRILRECWKTSEAAERERWESALGAEMPADFKCWHQNAASERPDVAAWVIRNLREREALAWSELERRVRPVACNRGKA